MSRPVDKSLLSVYTENSEIRFDWDTIKAASNYRKHKISFVEAITVFDDPNALLAKDDRHTTAGELREWIIGLSDRFVVVVTFTRRMSGKQYRLISARRANRKERTLYEEFKKFSL